MGAELQVLVNRFVLLARLTIDNAEAVARMAVRRFNQLVDWAVKLLSRALFVSAMVYGCVAFAAAPSAAQPQPDPTPIPPAASDMQWQIGVGRMITWSGEDPLINMLKLNTGERDWPADVFDRETQTFLKTPDGRIGFLREGAGFNPSFYAGDYIIDWDGEGLMSTGLKGAGVVSRDGGPNRLRERYAGTRPGRASAVIKAVGPEGLRNIRIYRAEHEAALKAGKIFNPDFVRHIARYDVVRTMDWNSGGAVTRADQIPGNDAQFWGAGIVPLEAQFRLAMEADVSMWLNAPARLGAPDGLIDQLAAMGKGRQADRKALTAANFDAIDASPEWDNYAAAVVAAMERAGYPADRPFYLELANETWNWAGAFNATTEWYWSLTVGLEGKTGNLYPGNPSRGAYGYFSAKLAEAFAKALDQAGRGEQPWTMVIGTKTAEAAQTTGALQGVSDYASDSFLQPMARYGVASTGYYRGLFHNAWRFRLFGERLDDAAWRAEWLRRFNADRAGFEQYLADAMTSDQMPVQNVAWIVAQSLAHKQIAEQFGARYIGQYEGSSHDTLDRTLRGNPEVLAFYKAWQTGPRHAETIRLHAEKMSEAAPGAILSNYQHWSNGGVTPGGPWLFNSLWGAETEAEKALFEVIGE